MTEHRTRRVFLVEMDVVRDRPGFSSEEVEAQLRTVTGRADLIVWGAIDGVDATYRKILQLSREIETGASFPDMTHSAHKALSFFRDIFPAAFWTWKAIGGDHPNAAERSGMAGR